MDRRSFIEAATAQGVVGFGAAGRGADTAPRLTQDVRAFGARGDGATDDTDAFQSAIDAVSEAGGGNVDVPAGTYLLGGTVAVPSHIHLRGEPGATLLGVMTPEAEGAFPNTMFVNADPDAGNDAIAFTRLEFDFAGLGVAQAVASGLTTRNSLRFTRVSRLLFEDCSFRHHVSNFDTGLDGAGKDFLAFGMAMFDTCTGVSFRRIRTLGVDEEVFNFYDCSSVSLEDWHGDGTDGTGRTRTSSHAGFWYCDGVTVQNATFRHTGGSVLNCFSRNVRIENVRVNDGERQAGRGLEFANELDAKAFDAGNVTVVGCTLNVLTYGIRFSPAQEERFIDSVEAVTVEGNRVFVGQRATEQTAGIRLFASKAVSVRNNYVWMHEDPPANAPTVGQCIVIHLPHADSDEAGAVTVHIEGNHLQGMSGIRMLQEGPSAIDGLYIDGNTFVGQERGPHNSREGAGTFLHFRNLESAEGAWQLSRVFITRNTAYGLSGGALAMVLDRPERVAMAHWRIADNHFECDAGADRSLVLGGVGIGGSTDVRIERNDFINFSTTLLSGLTRLIVHANAWSWDDALDADRVALVAGSGSIEFTDNRFFGVPASSNLDLVDRQGGGYRLVRIEGNVSETTDGRLTFAASVPPNTTLPNS